MKKLLLLVMTGGGIFLVACSSEPDPAKLYDELVVQTNVDPNANFSSYKTYSIATDTLGLVSNIRGDDTIIVGTNFARPVIDAVNTNLGAKGFQQVNRHNDPDVAINVFVVKNLDVFQTVNYYSNPYYGGYYGGYYPGYYGNPGYYYPGYYGYGPYYSYPYVSTYVSNNQVLVIEMVDLKNLAANNQVKVVWNAYMGDLYTALDVMPQTLNAINQAFAQSSYLSKNPQ